MSKENEHIEEKLIPYLEGVLAPKERQEIDTAIHSDGALAREMSELRELIVCLRQGFASGLRPPQEEVSVDEVVELGANTGNVETLPGSSQQKARLFCSDQALEEYSLLRALGEEMSRTTLDRDNIPEMPESLLKEFRALRPASNTKGNIIAFDRKKLSPAPLWRRASGMLDRIDPKPLMASAAALVMLSLGVHFYRTPADSAAPKSGNAAEIGYNFSGESPSADTQQAASSPPASSTPAVAGPAKDAGIAVFTSDDRGLLKEQAEKLMAGKVRYTVTKDRILVAERDVEEARNILWADAEGKGVAMAAKEKQAEKRIAQPTGQASAAGGASPAPAPDEAPANYYVGNSGGGQPTQQSHVVNVDQELSAKADTGGTVTYYPPSPRQAPARPLPPSGPSHSRESSPQYRASRNEASAAFDSGARRGNSGKSTTDPGLNSALKPKAPAQASVGAVAKAAPVDAGVAPGRVDLDLPVASAEPTAVPGASAPPRPMDPARRARLQELARGKDGDSAAESQDDEGEKKADTVHNAPAAAPPPAPVTQVQRTQTVTPARVAVTPPVTTVAGGVPNAISAADAVPEDSQDARADRRLAKMESTRQAVAQRNGVELSFESKNGKISVYVRPKKTLTKAEMDTLRKTLRKELGLADSDTIIIR